MKIPDTKVLFKVALAIISISLFSSCNTTPPPRIKVEHNKGDVWHQRLSNIKLLNNYIKMNSGVLKLENLVIENYNLNELDAKRVIITNSSLKKIKAQNSKIGHLVIEGSELGIDFGRSEIKKVHLDQVTGSLVRFSQMKNDEVLVTDSTFQKFNIGGSELNHFESRNSQFALQLDLNSADVKEVLITDCSGKTGFVLLRARVDSVSIANCEFYGFVIAQAKVKRFEITDSVLVVFVSIGGFWQGLDVQEFIFNDVHLDGPFEFEEARIGKLTLNNVTKGKNYSEESEGINFEL